MIVGTIAKAALFAAALLVSGCGGESTPSPTVTSTVTITASPTTAPGVNEDIELADEEVEKVEAEHRMDWAKDPNRLVIFKDYDKAKVIVARALERGDFGKTERLNSWKAEWIPGQAGWGRISAGEEHAAPLAIAWVWLRADGTIDYRKGVDGILIDMGDRFYGVEVQNEPSTDGVRYDATISTQRQDGGKLRLSCFDFCMRDSESFVLTHLSHQLITLEMDAMRALDENMVAKFGANWRTL